jgi:hypothetical protein
MNKIFFMALFFIKRSRVVLGHDVWVSNGPAFKCPGPAEIDHSKAGMVRLSDVRILSQTIHSVKLICAASKKASYIYIDTCAQSYQQKFSDLINFHENPENFKPTILVGKVRKIIKLMRSLEMFFFKLFHMNLIKNIG